MHLKADVVINLMIVGPKNSNVKKLGLNNMYWDMTPSMDPRNALHLIK